MLVSHVKHRNMSKSVRSSRDFAACMAMRQTGQWRMAGRRDFVIAKNIGEIGGPVFDPDQGGRQSRCGGLLRGRASA